MSTITNIPYCDTHGSFCDTNGNVAPTPNKLLGATSEPDRTAILSVLQFGAIIPPLSPWKDIRRLLPGYQYREGQCARPIEIKTTERIHPIDIDQQATELEKLVDWSLQEELGDCTNPVLLFSGGVDSGFIASRLASLGYRDSLLLNYSFGENDAESALAESMAKHLGLRFERISTSLDSCECLNNPGQIYPQPFGDPSTAPTSHLANSVVKRLAGDQRFILDGTGADAAFGMANKLHAWNRVLKIPKPLRDTASLLYRHKLWRKRGKLEYIFRILSRSAEMPLLSAVLAQNPLAGLLYDGDAQRDIDQALKEWIEGWCNISMKHNIVAADMSLTCANVFAQKAQPILESASHKVLYPFLTTNALSTAMTALSHWNISEPKSPLKRSLERQLPKRMIYRPKSAFVDPCQNAFFNKVFISHLRAAIDNTSLIENCLNSKRVLATCDLLSRKRQLPDQTLYCLWAIAFTDRWYKTALQAQ